MADSTLIIEAIQKGNDEVLAKMDLKMDTKFAPVLNDLKIITDSLAKIKTDIEEVQTRVSQNEDDISELKAKVAFLEKENTYLKNKAQDTENRNRMSNLRFIGVPRRSNEPRELAHFVENLVQQLFGEEFHTPPVVERAHRTQVRIDPNKPPRSSPPPPPPILARFLNYQDKTKIMTLARAKKTLTYDGATIHIFADFSPELSKQRQKFDTVKQHLRKQKVDYSLVFPATLKVQWRGQPILFDSATEAERYFAVPQTPSSARRKIFPGIGNKGEVMSVLASPFLNAATTSTASKPTGRFSHGDTQSKIFSSHLTLPFPQEDIQQKSPINNVNMSAD